MITLILVRLLIVWQAGSRGGSAFRDGPSVKLQRVAGQLVAETLGDLPLQPLYFIGAKLDDAAGGDVDEMVVMPGRRALDADAVAAEAVLLDDSEFGEKAQGPIDGR